MTRAESTLAKYRARLTISFDELKRRVLGGDMIVRFEDRHHDAERVKARQLRDKAFRGTMTAEDREELARLEAADRGRVEGRLILA